MAKEKSFFGFKKHEVNDLDPVKELVSLYEDNPELTYNKDTENKNNDYQSLKSLIEKNRQRQKRKTLIYFFIIFLAAVFSASAGFFYFSGHQQFKQESVDFNISGPEKIKINEPFDYQIDYENVGDYSLKNCYMLIQYPQSFILEKSTPEIFNHKIDLAEIKPGKKGKIIINGRIIDEPSSEQKLTAALYFSPVNFNSEFKKDTEQSLFLESPELLPTMTLPANVTTSNKFNFTIKIKNLSNLSFDNPRLKISFPENFNLINAKPAAVENNEWQITRMEAQKDSPEITFEGFFNENIVFANEEERIKDFLLQIELLGKDNEYFLVKTEKFSTKIIDQALNSYLIINGSGENKNFELGKNLNFSLVVKNNGQETYKQLELKLKSEIFPLDIVNWTKIIDKNFGKIQNDENNQKEIIWDKNKILALAELKPKKEIIIDFSLPIKTQEELSALSDLEIGKSKLIFFTELNAKDANDNDIKPLKSGSILMNILSNVDLGVKALYYFSDGTPIGSGPLPFQAGQKTEIQVFWDLSNNWHDLNNLSVKTDLPEYAQITAEQKVSVGQMEYDEKNRQIIWKIERFPESIKEAHANFGLEITPRTKDIGQIIKLTGNSVLAATDQQNLENIVKIKNITTSALEKDEHANTTGLVIK